MRLSGTQLQKLTKVLGRLAGGASLAQQVTLAATSPELYVRRFARRLEAERGVTEPEPELPWMALVDGCIAKRVGLEFDHAEDALDALKELRRLVPTAKRAALPTPRELEPLLPNELLALLRYFGDRLKTAGLGLVLADLRSDSYPLLLLPSAQATALVGAAPRGRLQLLQGAKLAKLQNQAAKSKHAEQAGERRQQAAKARRANEGGAAWGALVKEHSTFASAVSNLQWMKAPELRRFLAALPEAPAPHQAQARLLQAFLDAPERAARSTPLDDAFWALARIPIEGKALTAYVKALQQIYERMPAKAPHAHFFKAAARLGLKERAQARRALPPKLLERFKQLCEERCSKRQDSDALTALIWLGDEAVLDATLAQVKKPKPDEWFNHRHVLAVSLAQVYKRRLGWPKYEQ